MNKNKSYKYDIEVWLLWQTIGENVHFSLFSGDNFIIFRVRKIYSN